MEIMPGEAAKLQIKQDKYLWFLQETRTKSGIARGFEPIIFILHHPIPIP
jgi:hypothetical protein